MCAGGRRSTRALAAAARAPLAELLHTHAHKWHLALCLPLWLFLRRRSHLRQPSRLPIVHAGPAPSAARRQQQRVDIITLTLRLTSPLPWPGSLHQSDARLACGYARQRRPSYTREPQGFTSFGKLAADASQLRVRARKVTGAPAPTWCVVQDPAGKRATWHVSYWAPTAPSPAEFEPIRECICQLLNKQFIHFVQSSQLIRRKRQVAGPGIARLADCRSHIVGAPVRAVRVGRIDFAGGGAILSLPTGCVGGPEQIGREQANKFVPRSCAPEPSEPGVVFRWTPLLHPCPARSNSVAHNMSAQVGGLEPRPWPG